MEFRSNVLPSFGSSVPISRDEIPQKPPTPLTQKVISFDVSEISNISSEPSNYIGSINHHLLNNANICRSISKVPQYQSTPLNVVPSPDWTVPEQMNDPKLPQRKTGPIVDQSHCKSLMEVDKSSKLEVDLSVWEFLKRQEEKVNTLQEQISRILEQKAVPCQPDPKLALVPNNDMHNPTESRVSQQIETSRSFPRNSFDGEFKENSQLISCLQTQSEQILKLQEQNQKLVEQNIKLMEDKQKLQVWNQELKCRLLLKNDRKSLKKLTGKACPTLLSEDLLDDNESRLALLEEKNEQDQQQTEAKRVHSPKPQDIDFHKEKEIEKTSTSTMTSLVYDGSDKLVYQQLTTVTTDFKKQCNKILAECSPKDPVATPENRPSKKDCGSSSRRKKGGPCRKCGKCSPIHASGKEKSPHVDSSKHGCKTVQKTSPVRDGETGQNALQNCEENSGVCFGNQDRLFFPRYKNILRNVNELNLNCNEVDTTPRAQRPSLKPSSKERKKYTPSPKAVELSPTIKNHRHTNIRKSSSAASNTSTDSVSTSPNCSTQEITTTESERIIPPARTISMYGLASPNLSKDTRKYLESFGLVHNRSDDSFKCDQSRTLVKPYLR